MVKADGISRKKEKGEKTKRKILDTAGQFFDQHDFDDITVDAIVQAAGVSKGTFYVHFDSKDALIASFLSDYVRQVDADYKSHLDSISAGTKVSDILLSLIEKIADMLTDTIGYYKMRLVYKVALTGAVNMDAVMGYNRELYIMFSDVLGSGIAQGEFHTELSLDALTRHFVLAIRSLSYEWCIRYPAFDLKEQSLTHFKILLRGIR